MYLGLERQLAAAEGTSSATSTPKGSSEIKVPWASDMLKLNANESDIRSAIEDTLSITVKGIAAGCAAALRLPCPGRRLGRSLLSEQPLKKRRLRPPRAGCKTPGEQSGASSGGRLMHVRVPVMPF